LRRYCAQRGDVNAHRLLSFNPSEEHMPKKKNNLRQKLLQAAISEPAQPSKHAVAQYREIILLLREKNFSQDQIAEFLGKRGVRVHRAAVGRYLQKQPPSAHEIAAIRELLSQQSTGAKSNKYASQTPGAPDDATPSDAERRLKREDLLARARKERRTEPEEDNTDYSFLNVKGRPFSITPRE